MHNVKYSQCIYVVCNTGNQRPVLLYIALYHVTLVRRSTHMYVSIFVLNYKFDIRNMPVFKTSLTQYKTLSSFLIIIIIITNFSSAFYLRHNLKTNITGELLQSPTRSSHTRQKPPPPPPPHHLNKQMKTFRIKSTPPPPRKILN